MSAADNFRNLLLVAASDGRMAEAELRLLSHRAAEWGITDDEFETALQDAIRGDAALTLPADPAERTLLLKDMIRMMAADGRMTDSEKQLFALASTVLGVEADALNQLIDSVLEDDES
jgi:uncharacterized tellurite resistance protein B-like protein